MSLATTYRLLLVAFVTMATISGCETIVDVSVPDVQSELVAQSFFAPGLPWVVRVTNTVGFTSPDAPSWIDDAKVEIWEEGVLLERLARADSGTYVASGTMPAEGRTYSLRAGAPGYEPSQGHSAAPHPVPVSNFRERLIPREDSTSRRQRVRIQFALDDPPDQANHYAFGVFQVRWVEDQKAGTIKLLPPSLFGFESEDPVLDDSEFAFLNLETAFYREALFSDEAFSGERHEFDLLIQYDAPRPDADVVVRRVFAVLVLSLSEDFYKYWTTAGRQALANENPFAEPLRVHSNLSNRFGVFAGFQYRVFPLVSDGSGLADAGLGALCALTGIRLPVCAAQL